VAGVPVDVNDPQAVSDTTALLLWFNALGTNDAVLRLGGQPFDNTAVWYQGSDDDARSMPLFSGLPPIRRHYRRSPASTRHPATSAGR
jgi:hypothetical protein